MDNMNYFAYQLKTLVSVYTTLVLFGSSTCVKIIGIKVPKITDLDHPARLVCVYDIGGEPLYSVKWYKDDREFFRYMPSHNPNLLVFPTHGFVVDTSDNRCGEQECDVTLTQMSPEASGGYSCEVSEGGPTFRTDIDTRNMTVAALPLVAPLMKGFKSSYTLGETFDVTCYSVPTSTELHMGVKLNHEKVDERYLSRKTEPALKNKYISSTRVRFLVTRAHFQFPLPGLPGVLQLSCTASLPGADIKSRPTELVASLVAPQPLRNQKLEWPNKEDSEPNTGAAPINTFIKSIIIFFLQRFFVHFLN